MMPTKWMPKWLAKLWQKGIGFRLSILVVLILLPFAALSTLVYQQRYKAGIDSALQTETDAAEGIAVTFEAYLQGIHKQSLAVGHAIKILTPEGNDRVVELLMTSVGHSLSVRNISWVSREGIVLASSAPGNVGADLSQSPWFITVAGGRDMFLGNFGARGAISKKPSVPLATAIRDFRGTFQGAVVAEIDPSSLNRVIRPQRWTSAASLSLFDSQGTLVYHSGSGETAGLWRQNDPMLSRALTSGRPVAGTRAAAPGDRYQKYLSALVPVAGVGWIAGASCSEDIAFSEVRLGVLLDALLGAGVFVLAFLLAYLLGRNIVAPLRRLENDARLMGEGKPAPAVDPFAPQEVASLRRTLLAMTANLTSRANELRESEELLRAVFENVYDGVLIHDPQGRIIEVNERWLQMIGLTRKEAAGLTIPDISANPPPQEELIPFWGEVLAGESKFFEWRTRRPGDGSTFDVEVFICPIKFKGEQVILACVRDITERKRIAEELQKYREDLELRVRERTEDLARAVERIERETEQRVAAVEELRHKEQLLIQQSRLAAMGEMMGNIAHQWRQPLNLLGLIVQELKISYQKGNFSEELLMESVAKAMQVIGHMSQTIDDFRNLLSPDKAKSEFTAKEVVDKVLSMMQLQAKVEVVVEDECVMKGSRNEYSQVIINIIANAHDVFKERQVAEPKIVIRLFREHGRSVVTISDNGGGIGIDIIDRIFDPYFSTKGPDKGTGLGLFMSKTIIEKSMNGYLTARNTSEGAEFRIEV